MTLVHWCRCRWRKLRPRHSHEGTAPGQIIDTRNQYYSCSGSLGVQCLFATTRRGKREEAAGVGSSVSEDLTCSLLHNRHPVTFSSTATLDNRGEEQAFICICCLVRR